MNRRLIANLLGKVLLLEGACMLLPALVSLIYREGDLSAILISAGVTASFGFVLSRIGTEGESIRAREGFLTVALSWLLLSAFGALPFWIGGAMGPVDSFFEAASGFTTTGASVATDVEAMPHGLLMWRSFMHWIGGMGVLVLTLALIPKMGAQSLHLLRAESTGPAPGKIVPRIGSTTRILYLIYLGLTVAQFIALMLCGMNWFDSAIHTFGTAGTGGFSNYALSVGHFNSPAIELVIAGFLILFGVNFSLYYYLLVRNIRGFFANEELRAYLTIVAASVLLIALNALSVYPSFADSLRYSCFQVASIITTAGFATADFNLWPQLSRIILVLLMLIGCSAGSTGGGLKVIRVTLLTKSAGREFRRMLHPRGVSVVKLQGKAVDEGLIAQIQAFFFLYILIICAVTMVVSLDGFSFETNLTATISAISNIGPGLGDVGPMGSFAAFSPLSKIVLSLAMIAGRLELYPVVMLFMFRTWKRNG